MTCDEIDARLVEYVEGDLPATHAESFRAHIHECSACRKAERDTREILGGLSVARSLDSSSRASEPVAGTLTALADFEILEPIGRGGMGVVYRAWQRTLHRIVALKVLNAGLVQTDRAVARFQREAQAAARLHHTNIVPVYAQGQADGHFYYAMELIEGRSLHQVVADEKKQRPASKAGPTGPVGTASLSGSGRYRDYRKIARQIASKSPKALRLAKFAMNGIEMLDVKKSYRYEQGFTLELYTTPDSQEARDAFVEKRDAKY